MVALLLSGVCFADASTPKIGVIFMVKMVLSGMRKRRLVVTGDAFAWSCVGFESHYGASGMACGFQTFPALPTNFHLIIVDRGSERERAISRKQRFQNPFINFEYWTYFMFLSMFFIHIIHTHKITTSKPILFSN